MFSVGNHTQFKNKVFSIDIAEQAQFMAVGQSDVLSLHKLPKLEAIWEKRFSEESGAVSSRSAKNKPLKEAQIQLRVLIDEYASVVVSSSTNKRVTIYEAATGQQLCKASHGGITMAMCFSNNMKNLITASDQGLIFIWRLPDALAKTLFKIKSDAVKMRQDFTRFPSVVQEVEEEYDESRELDSSETPSVKQKEVFDVLNQIKEASGIINAISPRASPA